MATRTETKNSYTYLQVKHHSLVEESKEPREGFDKVKVFNPKTKEEITKYIDKWPGITGYIVAIEPYDTEDAYTTRFKGFKLNIDNEVILDLPEKTPAYDVFSKLAENIDFNEEVTISAYHNKKKDRTGFSIEQNGHNIPWKYTMDNMGDCPSWEKDEDGEWDSRKQRAFLKAKVIDEAIPKCVEASLARNGVSPSSSGFDVEEFNPVENLVTAAAASGGKKGSKKATTVDNIPF